MGVLLIGTIALWLVGSGVGVAQTAPSRASRPERYESAAIDADGNLAIVKSNGQTVVVRKEKDQTSFSAPVLSPVNRAIGAQAMFENCCTSYDIPLQLVVYAGGKIHRFKGIGLPVFQWGFANGGTQVVYGQEPVHFSCATHYEMRDIESERLLDSADVPRPCGQNPEPKPVRIPQWVADLVSKK